MNPDTFHKLVVGVFSQELAAIGIDVIKYGEYWVSFEGPKVITRISWERNRDGTLDASVGVRQEILNTSLPFILHEWLRVGGHHHLPEAQHGLLADDQSISSALHRLKYLLMTFGAAALYGDIKTFALLDNLRKRDCNRYAQGRDISKAISLAYAAWNVNRFSAVASYLKPFRGQLTEDEKTMLVFSENQVGGMQGK